MGNREAPDMGNGFLLILAVYYSDGFDGRRGGYLVTTLGITGFPFYFARLETGGTVSGFRFPSKKSNQHEEDNVPNW